jgi:hypothetical protein
VLSLVSPAVLGSESLSRINQRTFARDLFD